MNDTQIIWIFMTVLSFLIGVLVLFVKIDQASIKNASRINPIANMFRYRGWKYIVAGLLFCLGIFSFSLYRGWIA